MFSEQGQGRNSQTHFLKTELSPGDHIPLIRLEKKARLLSHNFWKEEGETVWVCFHFELSCAVRIGTEQ